MHLAKILGACPRSARPYRIRDEQKRKLLPAENALVKMPALTIEGRTAGERQKAQISGCPARRCMLLTFDAGAGHGDNVGRLSRGSVACSAKERRVSIANLKDTGTFAPFSKSGSLYGTNMPVIRMPKICIGCIVNMSGTVIERCTHVEDDDAVEHTANGLGDVRPRALSLRRSAAHRTQSQIRRHKYNERAKETYIATSSIPWKENAAWTKTERMPKKRSVGTELTSPAPAIGPGFFQY